MSGASAPTDRRAARREVLLDAAIDVVRDRGPAATMDDVADGCGISKPIIYRHFGDREGLVEAMAQRFAGQLIIAISKEWGRRASGGDPVRATIDAYLAFVEAETPMYRFLTAHVAGARRVTLASLVAESVAEAIAPALERQGRNPVAARPWAYGMVGMVELAGDWWLESSSEPPGPMTRDELVDHLMELIRPEWLSN